MVDRLTKTTHLTLVKVTHLTLVKVRYPIETYTKLYIDCLYGCQDYHIG